MGIEVSNRSGGMKCIPHFAHVKEIATKEENIRILYYFYSRALCDKARSLSLACQDLAIFVEEIFFLKYHFQFSFLILVV